MENRFDDPRFMSRVKLYHKEMVEFGQDVAEQNERVRFMGMAFNFFDTLISQGMSLEDANQETRRRYFIDVTRHQDEYLKAQDNNYFADYYQWNLQEEVEDKVEDNEFKNL